MIILDNDQFKLIDPIDLSVITTITPTFNVTQWDYDPVSDSFLGLVGDVDGALFTINANDGSERIVKVYHSTYYLRYSSYHYYNGTILSSGRGEDYYMKLP